MNERIKQLANEAGLLVYNPNGVPTKLEKFAKLIHDMRIALYKQDEYQVRSILDKLEYQMFEEGL